MYSSQGPSRYGRIPQQTVDLFQQTVAIVRDQVLSALPPQANDHVRAYTLEQVLAIVLRDWRENSNTTGLIPADANDLRNFVSLAVSLSGSDLNGQGFPVYQALLKGLLEDWLANWNAPNDPGAPGPVD